MADNFNLNNEFVNFSEFFKQITTEELEDQFEILKTIKEFNNRILTSKDNDITDSISKIIMYLQRLEPEDANQIGHRTRSRNTHSKIDDIFKGELIEDYYDNKTDSITNLIQYQPYFFYLAIFLLELNHNLTNDKIKKVIYSFALTKSVQNKLIPLKFHQNQHLSNNINYKNSKLKDVIIKILKDYVIEIYDKSRIEDLNENQNRLVSNAINKLDQVYTKIQNLSNEYIKINIKNQKNGLKKSVEEIKKNICSTLNIDEKKKLEWKC